jgi:hypothetical protein
VTLRSGRDAEDRSRGTEVDAVESLRLFLLTDGILNKSNILVICSHR